MAVFKVVTKNQNDVGKKPRVYFTCHPDDFDKYFQKICNDIFATHDCAIYYTEDMTEVFLETDKETDLGRMNLFVIPVTFRLLTEMNRAMDEDFVYAKTEHIPVLPIMMETSIDDFYSRPDKFGEMQYLSPFSCDYTGIPYREKLKKYLESVLISDEMAERIRAAFDAYIFLSYRKKDRKYANELMRLIHSQPECRDIAIWFDEFLTPGESFRENIKKILADSKLFTLLVTPNLLEEPNGKPNFVVGEEYPAAHENGIDILPAEMEHTDRSALDKVFVGLPNCVNPYDDEVFSARLLETVVKLAIKSNNTPEHIFLIGLAYLNGIDVEVDRERAVELITSAAETGLVEAMEKLAFFYHSGLGKTYEFGKAVEWQKKAVNKLEQAHLHTATKHSAVNYGNALGKLCIYAYSTFDTDLFIKSENKLIELLEWISTNYDVDYRYQISIAYSNIGRYYSEPMPRISRYDLAEKYLQLALELRTELATKDNKYLIDLVSIYSHLGTVYIFSDEANKSVFMYEKAIEILKQIPGEELEIAYLYRKIGVVYEKIKNYDKAVECYMNCIALYESNSYDINFSRSGVLSDCYRTLSEVYLQTHLVELSKQMLTKAVDIKKGVCLALIEKYKNCELNAAEICEIFSCVNFYLILSCLGKLDTYFDDDDQIIKMYIDILDVYIELSNSVSCVISISDLAERYYEIANICVKLKKDNDAERYYKMAADSYLSTGELYQLTEVHLDWGALLLSQRRYSEAEEKYLFAVRSRSGFMDECESPSDNTISLVSHAYRELGNFYDYIDSFTEAEDVMKKTIKLYSSMRKPDYEALNKAYLCIAKLMCRIKRYDDSIFYYNCTIDSCVELSKNKETYGLLLGKAYDGLALVYRKVGKLDVAKVYKEKAISVTTPYYQDRIEQKEKQYVIQCEKSGEEHSVSLKLLHKLALEYSYWGDIDISKYDKAIELGEKVYKLRCKVLGDKHSSSLISLINLAYYYKATGNLNKSLTLFQMCYIQMVGTYGENNFRSIEIFELIEKIKKAIQE